MGSCRRVTPTVAAEKRTMPTKDKTMKQSNSSPTIGGSAGGESPVDGERTMSPFGGSSALKAGAGSRSRQVDGLERAQVSQWHEAFHPQGCSDSEVSRGCFGAVFTLY